MAARKLQAEIDRVLKRVSEGVEAFDNTYKKMDSSTNLTQKEKLEADLKTQIKKLQRLRDQIKTWVASNDIKDKSQLLENRRLIETQMERFKACEKEMKTKAFSKEGLIQASKLDPKAQEKLEVTQWLQTKMDELLIQVEQAEAEIETLQGGAKKKKSGVQNSRLDTLEHLNERRKWHISRLEIVLRLLDNGSLPVEKVVALKDDVTYFVESNTEDDFDEDEGIYDELNLDEEEEKFGLVADEADSDGVSEDESEDIPPRTPSKKAEDESPSNLKQEHSPVQRRAGVAMNIRKASMTDAPKPPPPISASSQPMSSVLKNGIPSRPAPLPVRYAAAAAAAVAGTSSTSAPTGQSTGSTANASSSGVTSNGPQSTASTSTAAQQSLHDAAVSSPSLTQASVSGPSPMMSSASVSGLAADSSTHSSAQSPVVSEAVASPAMPQTLPQTLSPQQTEPTIVSPHSPRLAPSTLPEQQQQPSVPSEAQIASAVQPSAPSEPQTLAPTTQQQPPLASPLPQQLQQFIKQAPSVAGTSPLPPSQTPVYPPGVKIDQPPQGLSAPAVSAPPQRISSVSPSVQQQQVFGAPVQPPQAQQHRGTPSAFPGSLSDLVSSFENVKQKAPHRMNNLDQVHKLLDGSYHSMPQPMDTEKRAKPKYYVPKNPFPTPHYYPQNPHPILSSPTLFQNLDIETLFYVFYYLPGTYQQYLAAKELKRQSWRFHVKYLTWFQRHSEPQAITEDYEQGVYVYFDWEGSWCQRKKSDFRFEYRYLSED